MFGTNVLEKSKQLNVDLHNVSLSNKQHHNNYLYCRYVYAFKIDTIQQHLF